MVILDGFTLSKQVREALKLKTDSLVQNGKRVPTLAVVIVGDDPASLTYVASKEKQCRAVGFMSKVHALDGGSTFQSVSSTLKMLNEDPEVDGILLQLPLPKHLDEDALIRIIAPEKDVDGLHPLNVGLLEIGKPQFVPCTPKGIMSLLEHYDIPLEGRNALVIGRSRLVGNPMRALLLSKNATVTTAHSKTKNIEHLIKENDIIIVATGQQEFIQASMLDAHHVVIDVGIHRKDGKIVGDVSKEAYDNVAYITPVPKGVGPMTIVSLLENTWLAYTHREEHL